jgi:hypothetical protein
VLAFEPSKNLAQRAAKYYTSVQYFYAGFLRPNFEAFASRGVARGQRLDSDAADGSNATGLFSVRLRGLGEIDGRRETRL